MRYIFSGYRYCHTLAQSHLSETDLITLTDNIKLRITGVVDQSRIFSGFDTSMMAIPSEISIIKQRNL